MTHTIVFHYWRYGVGGAERVTYALMARLSAAGHRVYLFCDTPEHDGDYPLPAGVERLLVPRDSDERAAFWAERVAGLGIDTVVYGTDVTRDKNHPDIYLEAARRLGVSASSCVAFEDIAPALRSARAAGMATCAVCSGDETQDVSAVSAAADMLLCDWRDLAC